MCYIKNRIFIECHALSPFAGTEEDLFSYPETTVFLWNSPSGGPIISVNDAKKSVEENNPTDAAYFLYQTCFPTITVLITEIMVHNMKEATNMPANVESMYHDIDS